MLIYIKLLVILSEVLLLFWQWKWDIEKHPFQLRNFIAATGVEQIRQEILHVCLFVFLKLHVSVRSDVNTTA
jgi:hypothetical protein